MRLFFQISLIFLASIFFWAVVQLRLHSWRDDFSFVGDESVHFVTSAMVAEYLMHGIGRVSPVHFAESYYVHYPKVGIGHWPFVFHALLGAWMAAAGTSRISALLFQGICVALSSCLLFVVLRKATSKWPALVCALSFPFLAMVQTLTSAVMTEALGVLFFWLSLVAFSYWFQSSQPRWAYGFALAASAAIMTRPNAWALALVPPLAALILQRARPLFARPMIIAAIVVVIACVPFYVSNLGAMKDGNLLPNTVTFMSMAIHEQLPVAAMLVLGPLLSIPAFCGFWLKAGQPLLRRQKIEVFWAVMLSGLAAIAIFTIAIPSALDYNRFLYATLFPALAFAAAGIEGVFSGPWIRWSPFAKSLATAAFVAIIGSMGMMGAPRPVHSVFTRAARLFLEDPNLTSPVVLISSDGESGEGRFIAEIVAQQGECCRYFVERATQQLAVSNWDGTIYSLRYRTVEELRSRLNADRIGLIVVNNTTGRTPDPHHALLNRLVACSPDWREVARVQNATPDEHTQEEVIFYKNKQLFGQKPDRIRINLSRKIGRQLEVVP